MATDDLKARLRTPHSSLATQSFIMNEAADARIEALEAQLAARDAERDFLMEAVVLLDNGNGIPDDARYSFVERAGSHLRTAVAMDTLLQIDGPLYDAARPNVKG